MNRTLYPHSKTQTTGSQWTIYFTWMMNLDLCSVLVGTHGTVWLWFNHKNSNPYTLAKHKVHMSPQIQDQYSESLKPNSPWHLQLPTSERVKVNMGPALVLKATGSSPLSPSSSSSLQTRKVGSLEGTGGSHSRQRLDRWSMYSMRFDCASVPPTELDHLGQWKL